MNHSLRTASRETHVRIVAISLLAATMITVAAVHARFEARVDGGGVTMQRSVLKAPRQTVYSAQEQAVAR